MLNMFKLPLCSASDTESSAFLFVVSDFLCEYTLDIAEIKEILFVVD